jgi:hypothetical protein
MTRAYAIVGKDGDIIYGTSGDHNMTDLKARAREIADELASEFLRNYIPKRVWHAKVESSLLQFVAEAQTVTDGTELWLWKNGNHMLAFDNQHPCFEQGGDPMTLGEPVARAIFKSSFGRAPKESGNG